MIEIDYHLKPKDILLLDITQNICFYFVKKRDEVLQDFEKFIVGSSTLICIIIIINKTESIKKPVVNFLIFLRRILWRLQKDI